MLWNSDAGIRLADLGEVKAHSMQQKKIIWKFNILLFLKKNTKAAWVDEEGLAHGTKGTPYFMSPECALGHLVSNDIDVKDG